MAKPIQQLLAAHPQAEVEDPAAAVSPFFDLKDEVGILPGIGLHGHALPPSHRPAVDRRSFSA
jgi:hypothetical protein